MNWYGYIDPSNNKNDSTDVWGCYTGILVGTRQRDKRSLFELGVREFLITAYPQKGGKQKPRGTRRQPLSAVCLGQSGAANRRPTIAMPLPSPEPALLTNREDNSTARG
jgi:hypothetical protein